MPSTNKMALRLLLPAIIFLGCSTAFAAKTTTAAPTTTTTTTTIKATNRTPLSQNVLSTSTAISQASKLEDTTVPTESTTPLFESCQEQHTTNRTNRASIFSLTSNSGEKTFTGLDRRSLGIVIFGYVCFLCVVLLVGVTGVLVVVCRDDRKFQRTTRRRQGYQILE